jgi:hypothetical protein
VQVQTILDQVDMGSMALPEFQRGYVWNREQVRRLMNSFYRRYPVGSLLVWVTKTETADVRGDGKLTPGAVKLILDGQQRITSLYGIIRGKPPRFFEGNENAFTGLNFNIEDETFQYYSPLKMKDNPLWIDVSSLMKDGQGKYIGSFYKNPDLQAKADIYTDRLNKLYGIRDVELHIEEVTGEEKTVDVVVEIFNQVNSGGTKLSKGDLALAKVCAEWPDARNEMQSRLEKWRHRKFYFKLDWLLRCINTTMTGEAYFAELKNLDTHDIRQGLQKAEKHVDYLLNLISSRLGLDHNQVLGSRYSFPVLCRYLEMRDGKLSGYKERDKLLYWYIHTFLWGRYAGSTESKLNQDLGLIEEEEGALDRLIQTFRQERGDLGLHPDDFWGWSRGARFYPMLYMLTRVWHTKDWESGIELTNHLLGKLNNLQIHHIFPKSLLYDNGYDRAEVNAIANFTFVTQETNLKVSNRHPEEYLAEYSEKNPGVIESHWIPMNRDLWKIENYIEFLEERRRLLAHAANDFLDSLLTGKVETPSTYPPFAEAPPPPIGDITTEEEEELVLDLNIWVSEQGLPEGDFAYEVLDPETEKPIAFLDLAWPNGLQEGYSEPVAVLIDEDSDVEEIANQAGFRYFTQAEDFREYIRREILALEPEFTS